MKQQKDTPEVINIGHGRIVWVNSSNLRRCREMLAAGEIDGLGVGVSLGFDLDSIDPLRDVDGLKGLWFADVKGVDVSSLCRFLSLEYLGIGQTTDSIDLSGMSRIRALAMTWSPRVQWPSEARNLKYLLLEKFKPERGGLEELGRLRSLEVMELTQGTLSCLEGIQKFTNLRELQLHYLPALASIDGIANTPVEEITITHCKHLADLHKVSGCRRLRVLRYHDSAPIPSIAFINDCQSLKEFRFVGVDVLDGDLMPLLKLEQFAFTQKRHFSHTERGLRLLRAPE